MFSIVAWTKHLTLEWMIRNNERSLRISLMISTCALYILIVDCVFVIWNWRENKVRINVSFDRKVSFHVDVWKHINKMIVRRRTQCTLNIKKLWKDQHCGQSFTNKIEIVDKTLRQIRFCEEIYDCLITSMVFSHCCLCDARAIKRWSRQRHQVGRRSRPYFLRIELWIFSIVCVENRRLLSSSFNTL